MYVIRYIIICALYQTVKMTQKFFYFFLCTSSISGRRQYSDCTASNGGMVSNELERIWKEVVVDYQKYCPGISLEGYPVRDSKWAP
jgi:hypothetical protein